MVFLKKNLLYLKRNQNRIIIGGERPSTTKLRQVYSLAFPDATIVKTGSKTAEMVKYMTNTFLATINITVCRTPNVT